MKRIMYACCTAQGTACDETAVCSVCFDKGWRPEKSTNTIDPPVTDFVACTDNDALECQNCGYRAVEDKCATRIKYYVSWEIEDLDAINPIDAALQALAIHRDPNSIATLFTVVDEFGTQFKIDLQREKNERIVDIIDSDEYAKIGDVTDYVQKEASLELSCYDPEHGKRRKLGVYNFMFDYPEGKPNLTKIWTFNGSHNVTVFENTDAPGNEDYEYAMLFHLEGVVPGLTENQQNKIMESIRRSLNQMVGWEDPQKEEDTEQ